jgi:hypothetical protein
MSMELKPCDFCGGTDAFVERADLSSCYVVCNDCGARGPTSCDETSADAEASDNGECEPGELPARRFWNTRTNSQDALIAELEQAREHLDDLLNRDCPNKQHVNGHPGAAAARFFLATLAKVHPHVG